MSRAFLLAVVVLGCSPVSQPWTEPKSVRVDGLKNVYAVTPNLFCGSGPEGEMAFRSLHQLGVRTIISVDGAVPDISTAKRFGLTYVHLPIGYDGISETRAAELAKAIRDLPGPVYLHCHHGKHRGPTAAITAVRCLDGRCSASDAARFLQVAGTDPKYVGLYQRAEAVPVTLDATKPEYREQAEVPTLTRQMVELDEVWERVKKTPTAKDVTLLAEQFREMHRQSTASEEFRGLLEVSLRDAETWEAALREGRSGDVFAKSIAASCTKCHAQFRDKPMP